MVTTSHTVIDKCSSHSMQPARIFDCLLTWFIMVCQGLYESTARLLNALNTSIARSKTVRLDAQLAWGSKTFGSLMQVHAHHLLRMVVHGSNQGFNATRSPKSRLFRHACF
jgi:hypothetical protein